MSSSKQEFKDQCTNGPANQRSHYWHPAVGPVRRSFTMNGEQRMGYSWREVPRRINGESRGASKAQSNGNNERAYRDRIQAFGEFVFAYKKDTKHEYCGSHYFIEEVNGIRANGRCTAEHCQLLSRIVRTPPMREIV